MPFSCGQPIILSVITMDPSSGRVDEREHFFCYAGITADIGPFGEPASKIGSFGILCRHDANGVSLVALASFGRRGRRSQRGSCVWAGVEWLLKGAAPTGAARSPSEISTPAEAACSRRRAIAGGSGGSGGPWEAPLSRARSVNRPAQSCAEACQSAEFPGVGKSESAPPRPRVAFCRILRTLVDAETLARSHRGEVSAAQYRSGTCSSIPAASP